jgi:hypothetical protein
MSKSTPEGAVKEMIKARLEAIGCISAGKSHKVDHTHTGWYYMPVSNGMGVHGIPDFIGHYRGEFFAIEAKAPAKPGKPRNEPSALQEIQLHAIDRTGAIRAVVDSEESMTDFMIREEWIK